MPFLEIGADGTLNLVSPKELIKRFLGRPSGPCVVCGEETRTRLNNGNTHRFEFVHDYHEPEYIGCKEVWRYWQDREYRETKEQWRRRHSEELLAGTIYEADYDDDWFLDERDSYHDYKSYIASREWGIKSYALKRAVGWRCERCGEGGDKTTLHAHHKHYKTLYEERRCDIEVLCEHCHAEEHETWGSHD